MIQIKLSVLGYLRSLSKFLLNSISLLIGKIICFLDQRDFEVPAFILEISSKVISLFKGHFHSFESKQNLFKINFLLYISIIILVIGYSEIIRVKSSSVDLKKIT